MKKRRGATAKQKKNSIVAQRYRRPPRPSQSIFVQCTIIFSAPHHGDVKTITSATISAFSRSVYT